MVFAKCEVMRSIWWKGSSVNFTHLHNHFVSVSLCKKKKKKKEEKKEKKRKKEKKTRTKKKRRETKCRN